MNPKTTSKRKSIHVMNVSAKLISQKVSINLTETACALISASNSISPVFFLNAPSQQIITDHNTASVKIPLSIDEMRKLAIFLNKAADHIEADKDLISK